MNDKFEITKEEASLIRFHGGLDECLWSIDYDLEKRQRQLRSNYDADLKEIVAKLKEEKKTMEDVELKMNTFLYGNEKPDND